MSEWILTIILLTGSTSGYPFEKEADCYKALNAMNMGRHSQAVAFCRPKTMGEIGFTLEARDDK